MKPKNKFSSNHLINQSKKQKDLNTDNEFYLIYIDTETQ
jgi:hypothetical protein